MHRCSYLVIAVLASCNVPSGPPPAPAGSPIDKSVISTKPIPSATASPAPHATCGGKPLKVHFYDVSEALAALVELPDGRHVLVDTGDAPGRRRCGHDCAASHGHLMSMMRKDLGERPIDLLWITHQHSDHIGGAVDIFRNFAVMNYVDNGRDLAEPEIAATRTAATEKGVAVTVVQPGHMQIPMPATEAIKFTAIAPSQWLPRCATDRNQCSILLRIDYCASSILFTGDAEHDEEALLDTHGAATLLQVGHHGSDTSSGATFLQKVQPKYAVISAGARERGMNKSYCHPRESTVRALTKALGGPGSKSINAFDATVTCKHETDADWSEVPASDRLWATERDGDVVLSTMGDGVFSRE